MMTTKRIFLALSIAVLCFSAQALADDAAPATPDPLAPVTPDTNHLQADAEYGDSDAQVRLADAYLAGSDGLPNDSAEAMKWLLKAAEQGNPRAQFKVAVVYYHGNDAITKDYIRSYMWVCLLLAQNSADALSLREKATLGRNKLEEAMTTDDMVKANVLVQDWLKAHPNLTKAGAP